MPAIVSTNESARLKTLLNYDILDTPPEEAFDDITRLASMVYAAPIALICLLDTSRVWIKSHFGLTITEMPREHAFCTYTLLHPEILIVPDALRDERFATCPLAAGPPYVRFYAGAPLITASGHVIGTLCIMDSETRDLASHQTEALQLLARQIMTLLELRRAASGYNQCRAVSETMERQQRERHDSDPPKQHTAEPATEIAVEASGLIHPLELERERLLHRILESSPDCIKTLDVHGHLLTMNEAGKCAMAIEDFSALRGKAWADFWQGTDREAAETAMATALAGSSGRFQGFCATAAGVPKWWDVIVTPIPGPDGKVERLLSVSRDITEQKQNLAALQASEARLAEAQRVARLGSYEHDIETGRIIWSAEVFRLFDRRPQLGPPSVEELMASFHPDDALRLMNARQQALETGTSYACDLQIRQSDGSYRWGRCIALPERNESGRLVRIKGTIMDIHERKQIEQALLESEARLAEAQSVARIGSWEYIVATGELHWSRAMYPLLEFDPADGPPSHERVLQRCHPDDIGRYSSAVESALRDGRAYETELRVMMTNGSPSWFHIIGQPISDGDGCVRLFGTLQDINAARQWADRAEAENEYLEAANKQLIEQQAAMVVGHVELEVLASTDALTELRNRRAFQEELSEEFERGRRYHVPLSILLLDVDNFKTYNDVFGHLAGDQVLRRVAGVIRDMARSTDIAARYGGEEFVLVAPETGANGAMALAERIRKTIAGQPWVERPITVSVGVSSVDDWAISPEALVDRADKALYASKGAGRNRVTLYRPEME